MGKIFLVVGISGVGKSTVLKHALDIFNKKYFGLNISIVNFGDILLENIRKKYGNISRDDINRVVKRKDWMKFQKETAKKIKNLSNQYDILLVDTHFILETTHGLFSGTPEYVAKLLEPSGIIVITAPAKDVLARRSKDVSRRRFLESERELDLLEKLEMIYSMFFLYYNNVPLIFVENLDGKAKNAAEKLVKFIISVLEFE